MGCVGSESTKDRKRTTKEFSRDSYGNPLNDVDAAKRKDEKESQMRTEKQVEEVSKKNKELNKEIEKLRKENEVKKKQSKQSIEEKEKQMKKLEEQKNKEIQKLKRELQKEKQKMKENQGSGSNQFFIKIKVRSILVQNNRRLLDWHRLKITKLYVRNASTNFQDTQQ